MYYQARYYVPSIGRFASADTIVPDPTNPQSFNRYSYVENNPVNFSDPTGHCKGGGCAVVGGGSYANGALIQTGNAVPQVMTPGERDAALSVAGFIPGVGDVIDVYDIGSALFRREWGEAATIGVLSLAPGSARALRGVGGEIVEGVARYVDDVVDALCSFSADTVVMTEDGLKPISEVELYDKVLAYDEVTGEIGYYPVLAVWAHEDPIVVELTLDGEVVETTPEHPFYTAAGEWVVAGSLEVGDEIRQADWAVGTVEAITFTYHPQLMYNFTVATAHTYFVGDGEWLVHNDCDTFF